MNTQALIIALCWASLCTTTQAAEPIVQPQDKPKANAAQSTRRTEAKPVDKRATASAARRTGIEQGKVREIIGPNDSTGMSRRGKEAEIIEPTDKPGQILGPNNRPDRDKPTPMPSPSIEGSSVGTSNLAVDDVMGGARGRWRVLAEELALGFVGNCVAQLTNPDRADPRIEDPDLSTGAARTGGCPALPMRRDR